MSARTKEQILAGGVIVLLALVAMVGVGTLKHPQTVTVPTVELLQPGATSVTPCVETPVDPDRPTFPAKVFGVAISRPKPLTFRCDEGVLELPAVFNWDALVAERPACAAQLLDLASSAAQPCDMRDYSCFAAMCSSAWKFCPVEFRR